MWISKGQKVGRVTYPAEWRLLDEKDEREKRLVENYRAGGARGGGDFQGGFSGDRDGDGGGKIRAAQGGRGLGAPAVDGAPTKHVHLMIVQVMKPVWAAHGPSVKFEDLLYYAANLQ